MSKWIVMVGFLCTGLMAACGGDGSGVSGSKSLVSLSDGEITDLCEYSADVIGPARTIDCGGGITINVGGGSAAGCATELKATQTSFPNCTVTVSQFESCMEALADLSDAQWCSDTAFPAACQPLFGASCGGGDAMAVFR